MDTNTEQQTNEAPIKRGRGRPKGGTHKPYCRREINVVNILPLKKAKKEGSKKRGRKPKVILVTDTRPKNPVGRPKNPTPSAIKQSIGRPVELVTKNK